MRAPGRAPWYAELLFICVACTEPAAQAAMAGSGVQRRRTERPEGLTMCQPFPLAGGRRLRASATRFIQPTMSASDVNQRLPIQTAGRRCPLTPCVRQRQRQDG